MFKKLLKTVKKSIDDWVDANQTFSTDISRTYNDIWDIRDQIKKISKQRSNLYYGESIKDYDTQSISNTM